ncbi:hypothetical protein BUZ94_13415 [Mammaliicoccus sciuri]|uniref:hypothetical protein n=1 Tax=Mammaliicoccus sciuri TaxID=1296 RepID=UPI000E68F919|nr:hypothetical protein [Mammaliicoccus sciuri]RIO07129.1 hypothetical protein BUZ94_13415 [Mammaliicoccus sciuri]
MDKQSVFKNIITELRNQNTDEKINKITENMEMMYNIPRGVPLSFIVKDIDDKFFEKTDIRLITLFIVEAFKVFGRSEHTKDFITEGELKESKQFDYEAYTKQNEIQLPYEFTPVIPVNDVYSTKMSVKEISEFINSGIINYNFDIQREAKLEIRTNKIIKTPTLNQKNIDEMEEHLINDTLKESTLYFNAAPLTSQDGDELLYDTSTYTLMITKGTRIDVIDGFHRVLACQRAYRINPSIDFEFNVVFSNFTTSEAIKWQAQHSKAAAWSSNRITEMQQESKAAKVVKAIKDSDSEFQSLIYTGTTKSSTKNDVLITYNYLTEIIEENFEITSRKREVELANHISECLLIINEIKKIAPTFKSQVLIHGFCKSFKEIENNDFEKHKKFLNNLLDYVEENEVDFTIGSGTIKKKEQTAFELIKELHQRIS